ncbi:MAG: YesL family protein, partial [Lachnospiraceae bacterium]|nr:YesL family protein [Lachnospiraceae bacterium]
MGRLFDLDSPLFSGLNKLADLIYLNILTMICCIPIITIGASMTALNYVALKIVRNEEGYITRAFFKSFKQNFKQATVIWLILLLIAGVLAGDVFIFSYSTLTFPTWMRTMLAVVAFVLVFTMMHVFPVLARFDNSIRQTFKNSLYMGILSLTTVSNTHILAHETLMKLVC